MLFYAYYSLTVPPIDIKPHRLLMPVIANYSFTDQAHPMTSDNESARHYSKIIDGWGSLCKQIGIREYFGDYCHSQFPKPIVSVIRENIPYWLREKAIFVTSEGGESWGSNGVVWYIAAKLLWNPQLDVDELLDDYFMKMYEEAAVPMQNYFDILENTFAHVEGRVSLGPKRLPEIYNPVVADLEAAMKEAQVLARSDIVKRRVDLMAKNFEYVKKYLGMRNSHSAYLANPSDENYHRAVKRMKDYLDYIDILKDTYVINSVACYAPAPRDERKTMVKAREELRENMKSIDFITGLPEFWQFKKDPDNTGQSKGWHKVDFDDQSWKPLSIMSPWENQIGSYDGIAWYRLRVKLPELSADWQIYIRFEAVDESAWVYVNGKESGSFIYDEKKNPDSWKEAMSFDITHAVKSGAENVVAVKVQDVDGAGGIWKGASIMAKEKHHH